MKMGALPLRETAWDPWQQRQRMTLVRGLLAVRCHDVCTEKRSEMSLVLYLLVTVVDELDGACEDGMIESV